MKVLYLISDLVKGGASDALEDLANNLNSEIVDFKFDIFAKVNSRDIFCHTGDAEDLIILLENVSYDIIHYFKTSDQYYFDGIIDKIQKKKEEIIVPRIIITHCQLPSTFSLRLTPKEIQYASVVVFICKTAYDHKFHALIERKSMIYFGVPSSEIDPKKDYNSGQDKIVFVRGSDLNKCPTNFLHLYKKIKSERGNFIIAGRGERARKRFSKIAAKLGISEEIQFVGHLQRREWYNVLSESDIYLYQLPLNAYSAIDGTIQQAMLTGIPVVYLGPPAPAELLLHNESGYIAKNEKQFISFAKQLVDDEVLRKKIGKNGRLRILEHFSHQSTVENYNKLYSNILEINNFPKKVPLILTIEYYLAQVIYRFRMLMLRIYNFIIYRFKSLPSYL